MEDYTKQQVMRIKYMNEEELIMMINMAEDMGLSSCTLNFCEGRSLPVQNLIPFATTDCL